MTTRPDWNRGENPETIEKGENPEKGKSRAPVGAADRIRYLAERELQAITEGRRGRPSLYYTAKDVADIFEISPKTVYKNQADFHARPVCGSVRFPKAIIHLIVERDLNVAFE